MTKVYRNTGRDDAGEKTGMIYQKIEKERNPGRNSNSDPLGPNSEIGRKLRQYYDELVSEEIPPRFNQLLKELERKEKPGTAQED